MHKRNAEALGRYLITATVFLPVSISCASSQVRLHDFPERYIHKCGQEMDAVRIQRVAASSTYRGEHQLLSRRLTFGHGI